MNKEKVARQLARGGMGVDSGTAEVLAKIPDESVISLLMQMVKNGNVTQEQAQPVFDEFVGFYTPELK